MNRRLLLTLLAFAPLAVRAQELDIKGPQPELQLRAGELPPGARARERKVQ